MCVQQGRDMGSKGRDLHAVRELSQDGLPRCSEMPQYFQALCRYLLPPWGPHAQVYFPERNETVGSFSLGNSPEKVIASKSMELQSAPTTHRPNFHSDSSPKAPLGTDSVDWAALAQRPPPQTGLGPRSALNARVQGSNWKRFEIWQLHDEKNE